jgi:hypothetical protein
MFTLVNGRVLHRLPVPPLVVEPERRRSEHAAEAMALSDLRPARLG